MTAKKNPFKRIALALSLCLLILWALLGSGASLAWFTDTSPEIKNIFHTAEFKLAVSHRLEDGSYKAIDGQTDIFDDEALYEPGYVQVVYLKVENKGTVSFDYQTAVSVLGYTPATNVYGQTFQLQDYLKFGIVIADSQEELEAKLSDRNAAKEIATKPLNNYSTEIASLEAGGTEYMAIIVRMPEEVGNIANYRGSTVPKVELGIIVKASQTGTQS